MIKKKWIPILLLLLATGCRSYTAIDPSEISSINIIDRNGMSETISSKDRLAFFDKTDFLAPQPYQKVLRVFNRDKEGNSHSCITSYHPNGQIKQYLDAVNTRAFGSYKEWYANGKPKVESRVIGGVADINSQAEESWLFDGVNRAWDEDGNLLAEIFYDKGALVGTARYFHKNGQIWKLIPFEKGLIHGKQQIFLEDGSLFMTSGYDNGLRDGETVRYWSQNKTVAYQESYAKGKLLEATYFDLAGKEISKIRGGKGERAILGKAALLELQEYRDGLQEGVVKIFDDHEKLARTFVIKDGEKEGEEHDFYPNGQKKLLLTWKNGILQGPVQSWYLNGTLESRKEMSQNKKNGLLTAWYETGALMLVEEYENDKLIKGDYYRAGEAQPISKVHGGKGVASLFDPQGNLIKKVNYLDGKPVVS